MLDKRKERILITIVEDFIDFAEPVGSRTIARRHGLGISPATIRNEMADLEEMGYLEQPHTSAGRNPSELGYRYYVDNLMEPEEPCEEEKEFIKTQVKAKAQEIATVIQQTGQMLAQLTSYAALATTPCDKSVYRHIQLVHFGPGQAMILVVLASGGVLHRLMPIPEGITNYDLESVSNVLNAKLRGLAIKDIKYTIINEIRAELAHYGHILDLAMDLLQESVPAQEEKVFRGGIHSILNQPEFKNVERLQTLMGLLEQDDFLCHLLTPNTNRSKDIHICIGREFNRAEIRELSMVTTNYCIGDLSGVLAVLGPTRMRYARVTGLLRCVTESLTEELSRILGK